MVAGLVSPFGVNFDLLAGHAIFDAHWYLPSPPPLGKLSFKLVERRGALLYKSRVTFFVYGTVFWASEPMQMLVEAHLHGHKAAQLSGDIHYGINNLLMVLVTDYVAGQSLDIVRENILDFISMLQRQGVKLFFRMALLLLSQIMVLKEGLHVSNVAHVDNLPDHVRYMQTTVARIQAETGVQFPVLGDIHTQTPLWNINTRPYGIARSQSCTLSR